MQKLLTLLSVVALALLTSCASTPPSDTITEVKVMSYNIRVGTWKGGSIKGDPNETLVKIANLIKESGTDIVLLQEVDQNAPRTGEVDEPKLLADELGYYYAFAEAVEMPPGGYGIAIISRWPIMDHQVHKLYKPDYTTSHPEYPGYYSEQRVALVAHIDSPAGIITAIDAHLGLTTDQRQLQLEQIAEIIAEQPSGFPLVFAGDLNAEPKAPELKLLRERLRDIYHETSAGELLTFPSATPDRTIDYIFVNDGFIVQEVTVLPTELSDHRPVAATLQLAK